MKKTNCTQIKEFSSAIAYPYFPGHACNKHEHFKHFPHKFICMYTCIHVHTIYICLYSSQSDLSIIFFFVFGGSARLQHIAKSKTKEQ